MIQIQRIAQSAPLWRRLTDYAENCSWAAGKHLAEHLRADRFQAWESAFAALDGDRIVGYCMLLEKDYYPENRYSPWIGSVFVDEAYRGGRISQRMIEAAAEYARRQGFGRVYIASDMIGFYEKYGFTRIDELANGAGGADQVFVKDLTRGKIETERLFLREMTPEDFDALYAVLADSDIMRHYPYTFDEARVRNWIKKNRERYRVFGFGLWAVCLKTTGKMIGDCGLSMQKIGDTILPEIGYHIAKAHQRRGYAKEAARAVRDWTFTQTTFGMVYSYMKKLNAASSATARANGMTLRGEFTDDEGEQTVVYGISREEWREQKASKEMVE